MVGKMARQSQVETYFIRQGDYVKIGISKNVCGRIGDLQCASPTTLELIGTIPGNVEASMHDRFSGLSVRGEWFRLEGSLEDLLHDRFKWSSPDSSVRQAKWLCNKLNHGAPVAPPAWKWSQEVWELLYSDYWWMLEEDSAGLNVGGQMGLYYGWDTPDDECKWGASRRRRREEAWLDEECECESCEFAEAIDVAAEYLKAKMIGFNTEQACVLVRVPDLYRQMHDRVTIASIFDSCDRVGYGLLVFETYRLQPPLIVDGVASHFKDLASYGQGEYPQLSGVIEVVEGRLVMS